MKNTFNWQDFGYDIFIGSQGLEKNNRIETKEQIQRRRERERKRYRRDKNEVRRYVKH